VTEIAFGSQWETAEYSRRTKTSISTQTLYVHTETSSKWKPNWQKKNPELH